MRFVGPKANTFLAVAFSDCPTTRQAVLTSAAGHPASTAVCRAAMLDLGEVPPDQSKHAVTEAKAASPLPGVAGSCSAVNQLPKSVVRQIRMLRSVGAGGG